jgi:hypothetical protein
MGFSVPIAVGVLGWPDRITEIAMHFDWLSFLLGLAAFPLTGLALVAIASMWRRNDLPAEALRARYDYRMKMESLTPFK